MTLDLGPNAGQFNVTAISSSTFCQYQFRDLLITVLVEQFFEYLEFFLIIL